MGSSVTKFMKNVCACWIGRHGEECIGVDVYSKPFRRPGKCWILEGKPCWYFRDCVLGPEDYKYPHKCFVEDPAFEKRVRSQYAVIDPDVTGADARRCECGAALKPRQRYCDKCAQKRRQASYRNSRQNRHR
jgi:hypothetical protein